MSDLLAALARDWPAERLTLEELTEALGPQGFGVLVVLFALPNLLPFYLPGISTVAGALTLIACTQLALGMATPLLPGLLARRSLGRARLRQVTEATAPWLRRIERLVRPRRSVLTSALGERLIGLYGVFLSGIIIMPTPLTNGPPALSLLVMAIGLMEKDTATILLGAGLGVVASVFSLSILGSLGWALAAGFQHLIGVP